MDFRHPIEAVVPGAQGKILSALLRSSGQFNLRTLARVAGVSIAQASRVLPQLVGLGIVERHEVPPSSLFRLVPEHVSTRALLELADPRRILIGEVGRSAATISPSPVSVVAFGSFARGDGSIESDIDLVVVRPAHVDTDDGEWAISLDDWRTHLQRVSGNDVEILEVGAGELGSKLASSGQVWRDVRRDGQLIYGKPLGEIVESVHA